jgi:hypothetical protein
MSIKRDILLLLSIIVLSMVLFVEFNYKKKSYFNEKVYDLTLQYNSKIISNNTISKLMYDDIFNNKTIVSILNDANNNVNKNKNRQNLYTLLQNRYEKMKKDGIEQFHFHLANGESFLRFHKPQKYGDSLLFRDSIKQIIQKKEHIYGFEIGKYFEGYRYIYPIFNTKKHIESLAMNINKR